MEIIYRNYCLILVRVALCWLFLSVGVVFAETYPITWGTNNPIVDNDGSFSISWPHWGHEEYQIYNSYTNGSSATTGSSKTYTNFPNGDYYFLLSGCFVEDDYCDLFTEVLMRVISSSVPPPMAYLTVRRHSSATITTSQVDAILAEATTVLLGDDGNDFRCPVALKRTGVVGVFSSGDGSIDSQSEFNVLANGVNVVSEINWCGSLGPDIVGCASKPGARMAVVRLTSNEGVLWAHEYGHNKGLNHSSISGRVMKTPLESQNRTVDRYECNSFKKNL